ncbi:hypothetical protein BJX63DRAFT_429173 [Aspergillus granulosus]|uniref:FAD-binding domain-containing protein n=1 Tax=Aspergillus granulosus TaxID=176169 RepID=A0ABR4HT72_9EURO
MTFPHVLIIGSGITGLSLAQSLKKAGISYEIFEKNSAETFDTRPRDWGITLHWGSSLLHSCLPKEIVGNVRSAQVNQTIEYTESEAVTVINTATGECLKSIPLGSAGRFSHRKLLTLLKAGVGIQYAKQVNNIIPCTTGSGVSIAFTDGSQAHGDLVVGADGRHSLVREFLLGKDIASQLFQPLGIVMHNFVAQYDAPQAQFIMSRLHRFLDMGVNPNGIFFALVPLDIQDLEALQTAKFQIFISYVSENSKGSTNTDILEDLKAKTHDFVEPFRSAIAWLKPSHILNTGQVYGMDARSWNNHAGRVTLAGDSAHPFPSHRGQALNHALQDVYNITKACVEASRTGNLVDTITQYDGELVNRTKAEMQLSVRQSKMMHDWDTLMQSPLMTIGAKRVSPSA